ncbi:hypothetical protein F0562_015044 [Nyssa sinensis]|uniref:Uncharacterized protein n=1 Tax=Nyssa sinensis TaxID=561372 RepID=A0A5J4ZS75_9ASTE|nr:hypothetical protein F0562_015044 [Nyssa sinensis]
MRNLFDVFNSPADEKSELSAWPMSSLSLLLKASPSCSRYPKYLERCAKMLLEGSLASTNNVFWDEKKKNNTVAPLFSMPFLFFSYILLEMQNSHLDSLLVRVLVSASNWDAKAKISSNQHSGEGVDASNWLTFSAMTKL